MLWAALLFFRGGFWRADQRLAASTQAPGRWPAVVAVVPARDEALAVGRCVASLLGQDYPGSFSLILVDDGSRDGTAERARAAAAGDDRLSVVAGARLPPGWTGKLWAMKQGLDHGLRVSPEAAYVLFSDADIAHAPGILGRLVAKAETEGLVLASLMALLRCQSAWERLLVPAFVFFFQMLYPFPRVNDPGRPEAAAAGGCMLVRRSALADVGGLEAIRDRVIDDCALAALLKPAGAVWLGLGRCVHSLRAYERLRDIWKTVTRTAFVQLGHSPALLALTVAGMVVIYLVPPAAVLAGVGWGDWGLVSIGSAAWLLMAAAYRPTLRLYGEPGRRAFGLPVAALFYTLMTVDSARRHWRGQGSAWKGRFYAGSANGGG